WVARCCELCHRSAGSGACRRACLLEVGRLRLEHQPYVVLLPLPKDQEPLPGRSLQRVLVNPKLDVLDGAAVQIEALALDAAARIGLGAGQPTRHEELY